MNGSDDDIGGVSDGDRDETPSPASAGRRKDGKSFSDGNTREDGSYAVGKNRTPESTRFKKGDGRLRGRRSKGTANSDTEFDRELRKKVTIREDGKERKVTKGHAVDLRLIDNATRKGDNKAIEMVDHRRRRIAAAKEETARSYHSRSDHEILMAFLTDRQAELKIDPALFGDPAPEGSSDDGQE